MMQTRKVILFIVEGKWDERSLAGILEDLVSDDESISFQIVGTDLTSDINSNTENIEQRLIDQIEGKCAKEGFWHSDIKLVVQLMDMDGAFVEDDDIVEAVVDKTQYLDDCIQTKYVEKMKERNRRKGTIIRKLYRLNSLKNKYGEEYPYRTYYFSCNLEHVLHNSRNTPDFQKAQLAEEFAEKFYEKPTKFIEFLQQDTIRVEGDYLKTWEFIEQGHNALHRHCNFHLYFRHNAFSEQ